MINSLFTSLCSSSCLPFILQTLLHDFIMSKSYAAPIVTYGCNFISCKVKQNLRLLLLYSLPPNMFQLSVSMCIEGLSPWNRSKLFM